MAGNPELQAHLEWLGYVQPTGLVVSAPALLAAQAHINRNIGPEHQRFLSILPRDRNDEIVPEIPDFERFAQTIFGWEAADLVRFPETEGAEGNLASLEVLLPEYHESLRPSWAVPRFDPKPDDSGWLMLVKALPRAVDFDRVPAAGDRAWQATPQAKFERLLRETGIPAGLLFNHTHVRLVYAPRGESSGHITFAVSEMAQVAGRPIFAAMHMLFTAERVFTLPEKQRLDAILAESRRYQNEVSTELAKQVLAALYALVRGFQAANDRRRGELLREVLAKDPNHVYAGLLNVLMRLVFTLYAEDRGLLSSDPVYVKYYSLTGLFEQLREDHGRYPDTMDQRFGAWSQLLTLFRLIHEGGNHAGLRLPAREGYLFDADRYPFLEGRGNRGDRVDVPAVPDGVVFEVLSKLFVLDGERLSYSTLDVEQIGSVYEAIMGFNLEVAEGRSIAIKPAKAHGAPASINLDELVATRAADRSKWLADRTDQKLSGEAAERLKSAASIDDLLAALDRKIAREVTPNPVPKGAMVLQPSDERRRTGSHYTPRSLTDPIVRTTLKPILEQLGERPTPAQILDLKVCDPAMGSGAFLVEACRQLADALVRAWHFHRELPMIPPDEDEILLARRLIAQRCVYGVDKNPLAVDLAKLSLWLATLAKDHPFTFVDHSLRCGDSLVGLTREGIIAMHWKPEGQRGLAEDRIRKNIDRATEFRRRILQNADTIPYALLQQELSNADDALQIVRFIGDATVTAFFAAENERSRVQKRDQLLSQMSRWLHTGSPDEEAPINAAIDELRRGEKPIQPFHWQIEFPEVFERPISGFDAIVGNPPFAGKNSLLNSNREGYLDWLKTIHEESHGNADLVAHFFRRAFNELRPKGAFGLIATNTIAQGDTRSTGLRWICTHGGTIYAARRRYKWPGMAAVVVSVIHVFRGKFSGQLELDGNRVRLITAFLFYRGEHNDPHKLIANADRSFQGSNVLGAGFIFDDTNAKGVAGRICEMETLIAKDPRNAERIFPYIGGEEVNTSPTQAHHRFVIYFGDMSEDEANRWPDLMAIVRAKVRPERMKNNREIRKKYWWRFGETTPALFRAIAGLQRVLVRSQVSSHHAVVFLSSRYVFDQRLVVFPFERFSNFTVLQSSVHEMWARFMGSTLEDRLTYTPSDCYDTFPFCMDWGNNAILETIGQQYYEFRAVVMTENDEGLTKTCNRFHDPNETSAEILKLRELHAVMDRAVLNAYGWTDLNPTCEFLLDYEDEEGEESSRRRKPWRYRWPDDFRDEVLARLLELNKQRAEEERIAGIAADAASPKASDKTKNARKTRHNGPKLEGL
jgi:hypothetical protein